MLATSHSAIAAKVQGKGMNMFVLYAPLWEGYISAHLENLAQRVEMEYEKAQTSEKALGMDVAAYATLKYFYEFKYALGKPSLKPSQLFEILNSFYYLTPRNPRGTMEYDIKEFFSSTALPVVTK